MSNNNVDLRGYLVVSEASEAEARVAGWIFTDLAVTGGRHPFRAEGIPAQAILQNCQPLPGTLKSNVGVSVRGKLISAQSGAHVQARYLSLLDTSLPVGQPEMFAAFANNTISMQGLIEIQDLKRKWVQIGKWEGMLMTTQLITGTQDTGGHHTVFVEQRLISELARKLPEALQRLERLPVLVTGQLLSLRHRMYVQVNYLSIATQYHIRNLKHNGRGS